MAAHQAEVWVEGGVADKQGEQFRCCPLGVQFYSHKEIPLYRVMQLDMHLPESGGDNPTFQVTGIVVQSQFDPARDQYRMWILFTDLPDSVAARLKCVSKETAAQCPHCMNF
ncbi:MAG: hypothetical protein KBA51_01720 [Kiritimatiellae bacterium]|nr:hypothetical protein [Kiritimatiellia bacterium]